MLSARFATQVLALLLPLAAPAQAQKLGPGKGSTTKAAPKPATETPPPGKGAQAAPARHKALSGLRSAPSPSADNEGGEADPAFDPIAWLKKGKAAGPATGKAGSAASSMLRLATHPKRDELAKWIVDSIRGREIDVALLGGEKYMINDCLGLKASAGTFRLKLENPTVRFEDTGIVVKFEIDHVSLAAFKVRIRPNPNVLEACKFSKKFEVGGSMKDVKLTLHIDPMYDLERCRIGTWGDLNPEVRIGNLNLKPLQNDLDRMAKNMVEDALTIALQFQVDGFYSAIGELMSSAVDQFLEADCPTHAGDTAKALGAGAKGLGLGGKGSGPGGKGSGNAGTTSGSSSGSPSDASSDSTSDSEVAALLARIEELETRIAELEQGGTSSTDLPGMLREVLSRIGELRATGAWTPDIEALLTQLSAKATEPVKKTAQPSGAQPSGAFLVPNAELKGRMGRIVVNFADAALAGSTLVTLKRDGKKVGDDYGESSWELLPGTYEVEVTRVPVATCEVKTGHDTVVRTGVLHVQLAGNALWTLYAKGGQQRLYDNYGAAGIGLPVGSYDVEIQGQRETVVVREGEITRF